MLYSKIKIERYLDSRGCLIPIEFKKSFDFDVERTFFIIPAEGTIRGAHAKKVDGTEAAFCLKGSFSLDLDNGIGKKDTVCLESKGFGVSYKSYYWTKMYNFSSNCVVVVFSSFIYNEALYINNYNEFVKYSKSSFGYTHEK